MLRDLRVPLVIGRPIRRFGQSKPPYLASSGYNFVNQVDCE